MRYQRTKRTFKRGLHLGRVVTSLQEQSATKKIDVGNSTEGRGGCGASFSSNIGLGTHREGKVTEDAVGICPDLRAIVARMLQHENVAAAPTLDSRKPEQQRSLQLRRIQWRAHHSDAALTNRHAECADACVGSDPPRQDLSGDPITRGRGRESSPWGCLPQHTFQTRSVSAAQVDPETRLWSPGATRVVHCTQ